MESVNLVSELAACRLPTSFCGVTSRGLGGTVTHAIVGVHARQMQELPHVLPRPPVAPREAIAFWPAGGGELKDAALPDDGYYVLGTWMDSDTPQQMEEEEPGVYGLTVVLGTGLTERFQLLVDGDRRRVLRPARPDAPPGSAVVGPEQPGASGSRDFSWLLDARESWLPVLATASPAIEDSEELEELSTRHLPQRRQMRFVRSHVAPVGRLGENFRIRLHVSGRWRMVDWAKLDEQPAAALQAGEATYTLVGSWDWSAQVPFDASSSSSEGLHRAAVTLKRDGAYQFLVLMNGDWEQAFYPMAPSYGWTAEDGVLGPDSGGQDAFWTLEGRAGETFQVEFLRRLEQGLEVRSVTWQCQLA